MSVSTHLDRRLQPRPAERWVNWWRWVADATNPSGDETGAVHQCSARHPSRDVAETRAAEELALYATLPCPTWAYVGALPEGFYP